MVGAVEPVKLAVDDQFRVDVGFFLGHNPLEDQLVGALEHPRRRRVRIGKQADLGRPAPEAHSRPRVLGEAERIGAAKGGVAERDLAPVGVIHVMERFGRACWKLAVTKMPTS